ncbi:MAG: hypothetical protein PHH06_03320 [Candidatus Gracilibacteria bacterium]|nr:hypothetical protein [Candidatus Gracilibacteria bacterium]
MFKRVLFLYFLVSGFFVYIAHGEESYNCAYSGKIEECVNNQETHRSIEDFVCIQGSKERIVYQIVLDEKFKELDEEIEVFLDNLYRSKNYYFGPSKIQDFTVGVDLIEKLLGDHGEYATRYNAICSTGEDGIVPEVIECLGGTTSNINVKDFLEGSQCVSMYKTKLNLYKDIAYNILKENKQNILRDNHKYFTQSQRKSYDKLIDLVRINIGYIERLWKKWPSKTRYVN